MGHNPAVQTWATAQSTHSGNGRIIVWRFAENLVPSFERSTQPDRIILEWRYHSEMGLPVTQEQIRMDEMEDGLEPIEESGLATLALVSTGENLREWTYYAKSEDEFMTPSGACTRNLRRELRVRPNQ